MTRWHIVLPDAASGKALYDDLVEKGFTRIKVHTRDQTDLDSDPPRSSSKDAPILASSSIGRMMSAVQGATDPDDTLRRYDQDLEAGKMLLVVDFEDERLQDLRSLLQHHPDARSPEADTR